MKKQKIIFIISGIILIVAIIIGILFFYTYTVSGKITDLASKKPIRDVKISINGLINETDADGFFQIKNIKVYQRNALKIESLEDYEDIDLIFLDYNKKNIICNVELEPTIEVMANRINIAIRNIQHDYLWDFMHPDDQKYWESKENYTTTFKKIKEITIELGISKVFESEIGENIRKIDHWKHEITNKEYTDVMEVPIETKINENQSQINLNYWQKLEGVWRYFTRIDKEEFRQRIKEYEEFKEIFSE